MIAGADPAGAFPATATAAASALRVFGPRAPTADDVLRLLAARAPESLTLEYKSQVSERTALLDTACALLNTDGGDVLYGVAEDRGMPVAVPGVVFPDADPDRELLRLDALVRTGLEPTPDGFGFTTVTMPGGEVVVWLRCTASTGAPHRVRDTQKFMRRNSAGKHPMGVDELRQAFGRQKTRLERTLAFRGERLARLRTWSPVPLVGGARLVLHAVPRAAFSDAPPSLRFDDESTGMDRLPGPLPGVGAGVETRCNLDGVVRVPTRRLPGGEAGAYVQVFANGALEWVSALQPAPLAGGRLALPGPAVMAHVRACLAEALGFWRDHDLDAPWTLLLTLDGVGGWMLASGDRQSFQGFPADRPALVFTEQTIAREDEARAMLAALARRLRNAFGHAGPERPDSRPGPA